MRKNGFTLIELIVVIAIIVILSVILFPVFVRVRAVARRCQCASHLRQVGMALKMYVGDNNGRFFRIYEDATWVPPSVAPPGQGWMELVKPYVRSSKIYICPENKIQVPSYAYNFFLSDAMLLYPARRRPLREDRINLPSHTILCYDAVNDDAANNNLCGAGDAGGWYSLFPKVGYLQEEWYGQPVNPDGLHVPKHSLGNNICWVDGHVSWTKRARPPWGLTPEDYVSGKNPFNPYQGDYRHGSPE